MSAPRPDLAEIGRLAVLAHRAHSAWTNGRSGGLAYRGPGTAQAVVEAKGTTERLLREAVKQYLGEA